MKIIIGLVAGLVAMLSLSSCQKEIIPIDTGTVGDTVSNRVLTYTEDATSSSGQFVNTFNVTYDASGRLMSLISASSPGDKFIYQYSSNNTFTMDLYNSNILSIHVDFFVNSFSLVDSTFQYNDTQDSSAEKYLYNSTKQLVQIKDYEYINTIMPVLADTRNFLYDNAGNIIKVTGNFSETTYEYYPNLVNTITLGMVYLTINHNLIKTTVITSGGITNTLNHTYTFDSKNRLSTETITADNGEILIKTYTY